MSCDIPIDLGYEFGVRAPYAEVYGVLSDVPESVSHFPKVRRLVPMGRGVYRWEMERVGTGHVNIQTVYASKYTSSKAKGTVVWTPVAGVGNAEVSGRWTIVDHKTHTGLTLEISGVLHLELPAVAKAVVAPIVQVEFEQLVETYIDNLIERFGGEVE